MNLATPNMKKLKFNNSRLIILKDSIKKIIMHGGMIRKTIMQTSNFMRPTMDGGIIKKVVEDGTLIRMTEMQGCRILRTEMQGNINKRTAISCFQHQLKLTFTNLRVMTLLVGFIKPISTFLSIKFHGTKRFY